MKYLLIFIIVLFSWVIFPSSVNAQYNASCPSIYGSACPAGNLFVDKKIKNPISGELVETLNANEVNFLVGQDLNFRVEVKNTGNVELKDVNVQDKLPSFVSFVSGPGKYNQADNTLSWSIASLKAGESQFFDIKVKVKADKGLPEQGMTCLTNYAQASVDRLSAEDMAGFCIQTKILGEVSELPQTGVKETVSLITLSFLTLFTGIFLLKRNKLIGN